MPGETPGRVKNSRDKLGEIRFCQIFGNLLHFSSSLLDSRICIFRTLAGALIQPVAAVRQVEFRPRIRSLFGCELYEDSPEELRDLSHEESAKFLKAPNLFSK